MSFHFDPPSESKPRNPKVLTDLCPMPFGKHQGRRMQDVPASYLFWLWTECGFERDRTSPVAAYIRTNLDLLIAEYPDGIWEE